MAKKKSAPASRRKVGKKAAERKPPKAFQFKKGESGNPKGRPKGSKNLATLIAEAAYDQITVTTKTGQQKKLTRIQATTLQLANKAAQGDMQAMLKFMSWVDEIEQRAAAARPSEPTIGDADLAVLRVVYGRLKQCEPPKAP